MQWTKLTHSTLIIGYGTEEGTGEKYWKVRNSYGDQWGDGEGNFLVRRGHNDFGCEAENIGITPFLYEN